MPRKAIIAGRWRRAFRRSILSPARNSSAVSSSALAVARATKLVRPQRRVEQFAVLEGRELSIAEAAGEEGRPEAIAGPGEVMADRRRVEARIDAAEEDEQVRREDVGDGLAVSGGELGRGGFPDGEHRRLLGFIVAERNFPTGRNAMTEQEWLCAGSIAMLQWLQHRSSDRKHRLFGVACCRRLCPSDQRLRLALEVAEIYADGELPRQELRDVKAKIEEVSRSEMWGARRSR